MPKQKKETNEKESNNIAIDTKKLENEIEKKVREKLIEELYIKIDYETKNKLDKMEKKIYKYKKRSLLKRNVIILILLLIILFETKLLYDDNILLSSYNSNNTNTYIKEEIDNNKDKEWYIENYSYLLDNIKTNLGEENYLYLYKSNYEETTIDNKIRLNMAYQLSNPNIDNNVISITEQELKESYKKIFGSLDNYKAENFTNNCIQFVYNKKAENYMAINIECEINNKKILEKITNIYGQDNDIVIDTIAGIYDNSTKSLYDINENILKEDYSTSDNLEELENKLNNYKYIFEKIDDSYYLKEINKIN